MKKSVVLSLLLSVCIGVNAQIAQKMSYDIRKLVNQKAMLAPSRSEKTAADTEKKAADPGMTALDSGKKAPGAKT